MFGMGTGVTLRVWPPTKPAGGAFGPARAVCSRVIEVQGFAWSTSVVRPSRVRDLIGHAFRRLILRRVAHFVSSITAGALVSVAPATVIDKSGQAIDR